MPNAAIPCGAKSDKALNGSNDVALSATLEEKILRNEKFCSFEVFSGPDTTEGTCRQLISESEPCSPLFYSITWRAATFNMPMESQPSLKYFENLSNITVLHLPARGLSRKNVMHVLNRALEIGKANIFALQGDLEIPNQELHKIDFPYAIDLVKFIRAEFGSKFTICVAGYPQMHPRSSSKEADLVYLKAKVDAGANFIITQIVFESEIFIEFVKDCRQVGITVPIIPGVFFISNFNSTLNVLRNCKIRIPPRLQRDLELIKVDEVAVQEYGLKSATIFIQEIFKSGTACGFHLFTLNRSQLALELCKRVGICKAERQSESGE